MKKNYGIICLYLHNFQIDQFLVSKKLADQSMTVLEISTEGIS